MNVLAWLDSHIWCTIVKVHHLSRPNHFVYRVGGQGKYILEIP